MLDPWAMRSIARFLLTVAVALATLIGARRALAQDERPIVRVATLDGVIHPVAERYLQREIDRAEKEGAAALVVRLDTPGGYLDSTRALTQAILDAKVPIVVWVAPSGAQAASAGTFVVLAAHVAAMAEATSIGAAHPVPSFRSGDQVVLEKATNDAAAWARSLADLRGRDAAFAESAVRESASLPARAAVEGGVVDVLADDLPSLLAAIDGRSVTTRDGPTTIEVTDAIVRDARMPLGDRVLQAVANPNVAYVLFVLGLLALAAEVYTAGFGVAGVAGGIALLLALLGFGILPIGVVGIVLMVLAIGLVLAELHLESGGLLGVLGLVVFALASFLLYRPIEPSPGVPSVHVEPWVIALVTATLGAIVFLGFRALLRVRATKKSAGPEALVGASGVATTDLAPNGRVRIDGEDWSARAVAEPIARGERIEVARVEGIVLQVARLHLPAPVASPSEAYRGSSP